MADRLPFLIAASELERATTRDADLCDPFVRALGMDGAWIVTLGPAFGAETVCASDARAARLAEIQLDLGEGASWTALASHRPVLEPDMRRMTPGPWPVAAGAMRGTGARAVFAFPLVATGIDAGAVGLHAMSPGGLTGQQVDDASGLAAIVARQLLRRAALALEAPEEDHGGWEGRYSRREVHQATGMVVAQMGVTAADALLILRGHAFAVGRPVRELAADVVDRLVDFTPDPDPDRGRGHSAAS